MVPPRKIHLFAAAQCLIFASLVSTPGAFPPREVFADDASPALLYEAIEKQTVRITVYDLWGRELNWGGGVIVNDEGAVITSIEVLEGGSFAEATTYLGDPFFIDRVVAEDGSSGLVLVQLEEVPEDTSPVTEYGDFPKAGETVFTSGADQGRFFELVPTSVEERRPVPTCPEFLHLRLTAPLPGRGGPIFDQGGRLAGILLVQTGAEKETAVWVSPEKVRDLAGRLNEGQNYPDWSRNAARPWKWSPTGSYLTGLAYYLAVRYGQAQPFLEKAVEEGRGICEATYYYLGNCYEAERRYLLAMLAYADALALDPRSLRASEHMAWLYRKVSEVDEAYAELLRGVWTAWGKDRNGHLIMARTMNMCGQFEDALPAALRAVRTAPDCPCAHNELGTAYHRLGMYDMAVEALLRATTLDPDYGQAFNNLGYAYLRSGRFFHAIVVLKHAAMLEPGCSNTLKNLGEAYAGAGLGQKALEAYGRALTACPEDPHVFCRLAEEHARQGNPEDTISVYRNGIRVLPNSAWLHFKLGRAYCRTGDRDSALAQYDILLGLNRDLADLLFVWIDREAGS